MKRNPLRLLAFSSAVALAMSLPHYAHAQTETVNATLITSSAITTTDVSDMDFGEWLIQFVAGDAPTVVLTSDGSAGTSAGGTTANGSVLVEITDSASEGVVQVEIPAPTVLTMTRSGTVAFADGGLALSAVAYRTATEGPNALNADAATGNVTVVAGATPEDINFGGTILVDATPADNTHTASFDVTLSY